MAPQTQSTLLLVELDKPLVMSTIPVQDPEEGRVQVKISATGLLPADQKIREKGILGVADILPIVLGFEIAGRVVSAPPPGSPSSSLLPIGTRVAFQPKFGPPSGGLKEYASADPDLVFRIPEHISDEQAATLGCNPFTAAVALFDPVFGFGIPLPSTPETEAFNYASTKIVIVGGTAIAKFTVQQARLVGVGTIVAIASPSSLAELTSYGATHGVDRHLAPEEVTARVHAIVGDDLRFVFDTYTFGDPSLARSFFQRPEGILCMAASSGPRDQVALTAKGVIVKGFRAWMAEHLPLVKTWLPIFNGWLADGKIVIPPFQTIPFEADAVNEALDEIKKASAGVKFVVRIGAEK